MLRETFLVERHLQIFMLFAQEALQVSIHSFGVLHRLQCTHYQTINDIQSKDEDYYQVILLSEISMDYANSNNQLIFGTFIKVKKRSYHS